MVLRKQYLERLVALKNTPDIKIVTGVRRSGKSTLMAAFLQEAMRRDPSCNIIFVDFNNLDDEWLKDYHSLHEYIRSKHISGVNNIVFVDEIQECIQFERAINSLHASGLFDIYITGSNAFLLSSDLATLFTGRFLEIEVFPFSFLEFGWYDEDIMDIDTRFDRYVEWGGMPGSYAYAAQEDRQSYLNGVYKTIVQRDLVQRYRIHDPALLDQITMFLLDNVSNLTNPNRITNTLISNHFKTNNMTVTNYLTYLVHAYLFYPIKRYDIRGKQYLDVHQKYYLIDHGFRSAVLGRKNLDYGRIYENIVCMELRRRGYEVYTGVMQAGEVDFVAKKGDRQLYVQVADDVSRPETLERELRPLRLIRDGYPKLIVARTKHDDYDYDGIRIVDIARWLLHPQESA